MQEIVKFCFLYRAAADKLASLCSFDVKWVFVCVRVRACVTAN